MSFLHRFVLASGLGALTTLAATAAAVRLPASELNLKLTAPISTWDEAIPLGNGTMGVLLWGEGNRLRLSLDRGDLWDERPSQRFTEVRPLFNWRTMQGLVASNRMAEFHAIFDSNYDYNAPPTKLPAGRVELTLDPTQRVEAFELNLATAEGLARFAGGGEARVLVNAAQVAEPVAVIRIAGPPLRDVTLRSPDSVKKLGYPPPRTGTEEGWRWFEQEAADGFAYAVGAGWKRVGEVTLLALSVSTRREGQSPQAVARRRIEAALEAGYDAALAAHAAWWAAFWQRSSVFVPEPHILQGYTLARYFYGAASRRGAPPMPLQGVWSADAGELPPWKGDYHNDLNTQMTYLAYRTSGDFDEGASFLDYLWNLLPTFRQFARDFYAAPGAAVPGVMSLAGQALGGWGQYSLSPTMGAWNAHLFYLHWRHTGDDAFLRERAYPFCREIGECLRALLAADSQGLLKLPLSSSPEVFDNTRRAFLAPNTNYDLASLKMLFLALAEMAEACGEKSASAQWLELDRRLGGWHLAADGTLLLDATTPLPGSHRHLSNLMPLHPFNLITTDGGAPDRRIIAASLQDWDRHGTKAWCGYSFSWMACLRARVGDAEAALRHLDIYARAFILRNGFHANGDQTKTGFSALTYRPFTLEGNFLAMDAVHEMLLQSWSSSLAARGSTGAPGPGRDIGEPGPIRLFPSMPWRWPEASFEDLRAEGGHRVSAKREHHATTWFRIVAGRDGTVRLRNNFDGREPQWNRSGVRKIGDHFEIALQSGEAVEATLPRPERILPAPANAAEPVVIRDLFSDTWVATDALGRTLPSHLEVGPPRPDRTVGLFYFLWHGEHIQGGPYDITRILKVDPDAMQKPGSPLWGPLHAPHHWGESLFGYYLTNDEGVLRKHGQMLADAGIDVVIFDVTNQVTYRDWYRALLRVWSELRALGNRTPQVAFLTPFWDPPKVVRELWRDLYEPGLARDLWFLWDGKPLILADPDLIFDREENAQQSTAVELVSGRTLAQSLRVERPIQAVSGRFPTWRATNSAITLSVRREGPTGERIASQRFERISDNAWLTLRLPRAGPPGGYYFEATEPSGPVGWWSHTNDTFAAGQAFADGQPVPGDRTLRVAYADGEAAHIRDFFTFRKPQPDYFQGPTGADMWSWLEVYPQHVFRNARGEKEQMAVGIAQNAVGNRLATLSEPGSRGRSYHAGATDTRPDAVRWGLNAAEQWGRALSEDPRFIFLTGWNEWIAGRFNEFNGVRLPVMFVDQFNQEHSRDIEPMRGGHGDDYFYQMASDVRRYKGARTPQPIQPRPIRVDGRFDDWREVAPEFRDTVGDPMRRDHRGWDPNVRYTNLTGRNDLVAAQLSSDLERVSFRIRTSAPITPATDAHWMLLFLDTDANAATGWMGYDFVVNRARTSAGQATIERHAGGGYTWSEAGAVDFAVGGSDLELAVPWAVLGFREPPARLDFKWADGIRETGDWSDFILHGDVAPNDRFNYRALLGSSRPT